MAQGKSYIGTSGWSYAHWGKGRFYPKKLKQADWLSFFARRLDTVEVNASFYHLPKTETVQRWHDITGPDFKFAVKLWRQITHIKRLADCSEGFEVFFSRIRPLASKQGPILMQLPPSLKCDVHLLETALGQIKAATTSRHSWGVAVEFRNPEWLTDPVYRVLERHQAALCLADMPRCPVTEPVEGPFVYVRRHGPGGKYRGCYAEKHIAADADRIRQWLTQRRDVYVYYNNDIDGHAVDNARRLAQLLAE